MPDGDPAVESQLEGFSLWFPLPYRVGFIVTLGALNLPPSLLLTVLTFLQLSGVGLSTFTTSTSLRSMFPL